MSRYINRKNIFFLIFSVAALWMVYRPISNLVLSSPNREYYSHIVLIPLISAYLLYTERKRIFSNHSYSLKWGLSLMALGMIVFVIMKKNGIQLNPNDLTSLTTASAILFWIGSFVLLYGTESFRKGIFPVLFVAFTIPIPSVLLEQAIYFLQVGSTELSYLFLKFLGIPVFREGFVFNLPGMSVKEAKECSGIRSSMALFILGILASHLFLKTGWKRGVLILLILPLAILKNAIRIVTLSSLAVYVDQKFITQSFLHHSGGFVFFIPSLIILGLVLWLLKKSEPAERLAKDGSGIMGKTDEPEQME
jgi:exosortase